MAATLASQTVDLTQMRASPQRMAVPDAWLSEPLTAAGKTLGRPLLASQVSHAGGGSVIISCDAESVPASVVSFCQPCDVLYLSSSCPPKTISEILRLMDGLELNMSAEPLAAVVKGTGRVA